MPERANVWPVCSEYSTLRRCGSIGSCTVKPTTNKQTVWKALQYLGDMASLCLSLSLSKKKGLKVSLNFSFLFFPPPPPHCAPASLSHGP